MKRKIQKWSLLQVIERLTVKAWGRGCVIFGEQKNKEQNGDSFKNGEILWMKNNAIIEFGVRRIWRILQTLEGVIHLGLWPSVDNTLSEFTPYSGICENC